jgi:NAD(P)-dependent dehydrogenase (short-subunit alcohol dehydrogenase family)
MKGTSMSGRMKGRRVVVTQAIDFMGPAIAEVFREEGAEVVADTRDLRPVNAAAELVKDAGHVDVLIANLIAPDPRIVLEEDTTEALWQGMFDTMVHPLYRLVHAVLPQMKARRAGKVVVMGSANALRGTHNRSAYSAARGAQVSYVRCVGLAMAPHNVQINLMAQNFVENPTSFATAAGKVPDLAARLKEVPVGRLATGRESALTALFLAGSESDFFVGQVVPFAGGWTA